MQGTDDRDPHGPGKRGSKSTGRHTGTDDSDPEKALRELGRLEDERHTEGAGVIVAIVVVTAAVVAAALWLGIASLRL